MGIKFNKKRKDNENESDSIDILSESEKNGFDLKIENYDEDYDKILTNYEERSKPSLATGPYSSGETEEDSKKKKKKPKKIKKKKSGKLRALNAFLGALAIISVSAMLAAVILFGLNDILGIYKDDHEIQVVIPQNSSTADIARILQENGVINYSWLFRGFSKISGDDAKYQYGMFVLNSKWTYDEIISQLQEVNEFRNDTVSIVFKEGWTLREYANALEENNVCTAEDFLEKINRSAFGYNFEQYVESNRLQFHRMEGFAFPDTYEFYLNSSPEIIAQKMMAEFDENFTPEMYQRAEELNMTLSQVITLASIIQAEAGDKQNSRIVSSVFHNRLLNPNIYPRLESDPTAKYARNFIEPFLSSGNTEIIDAYDTYYSTGLPPGPICNPGIVAIEAALNPAQSKYFYFCSNINTRAFFYAETLSEHNRNLVEAGLK